MAMENNTYRSCKRIRINGKKKRISHIIMEKILNRSLYSNEVVHHIDENPQNNISENLKVMTISEHMKLHHPKDSSRFGVSAADNKRLWSKHYRREQAIKKGTKPRKFKITKEIYSQIINLLANNYKQSEIARMFDVNQSVISQINTEKQLAPKQCAHNELNPTIRNLRGEIDG
jgi:hypothetical protein